MCRLALPTYLDGIGADPVKTMGHYRRLASAGPKAKVPHGYSPIKGTLTAARILKLFKKSAWKVPD